VAIDTAASLYAHRKNPDQTWDAICLKCFRTIATAEQETDLIDREANHKCDGLKKGWDFQFVERRVRKRSEKVLQRDQPVQC
jgi:hypothetical protein